VENIQMKKKNVRWVKNSRLLKIRKIFICTSFFSIFLINFNSCYNKNEKIFQIGILSGSGYYSTILDGFKEMMKELGYIEGKSVFYDIQITELDREESRQILEKFVQNKVDLILVFPTEPAVIAKEVTLDSNIPVIFANVLTDGMNLIDNIREPGGNITGVRWFGLDLVIQRLEIMRELVPDARSIWVPYKKTYKIVPKQLEVLHEVCNLENLELIEIPANDSSELDSAFQKALQQYGFPDAILMIIEPLCISPNTFVVTGRFARKNNTPLGGAYMSVDGYESLFGLMPETIPQGRQAAFLADKVLKGTPAGTIPVVTAENSLILNCKEAKRLGLPIDENVIIRSNMVIR